MLGGLRIIDLTDERGTYAGYLLAALGAEVITIEDPEGSSARRAGTCTSSGESLHWMAFGRGRHSVVLDRNSADGRQTLGRLVATADVLLETGYGRLELEATVSNDRLIRLAITPFGIDGPKANWPATDLTLAASAGQAFLTGEPDRAPLRISVDQVYLHACLEGVGAVLVAYYEREHHSGRGQDIDVSAQEAFMLAAQCQMLSHGLNGKSASRGGGGSKVGPIAIRFVFPCIDGYVCATVAFGPAIGPFVQRLMHWIHEEGGCDEATRDKDWIGYGALLLGGHEPMSEWERVQRVAADFFAGKTKGELLAAAMERHLAVSPISTMQEVLDFDHYRVRGCFDSIDGVSYPGRFATFSASPLRPLSAAPVLGAHTEEVLERPAPPEAVRASEEVSEGAARALAGLKVLDFMWVMAGPAGSRVLADHGATVVRVESTTRIDAIRTLSPFRDDVVNYEFSGPFHNVNAGKLGITLDLTKPEARAAVHDLVRWADVVVESFSPGVFDRMGFGYDALAAINPSIILVSTSLLGQDGPLAGLAGYGTMGAAVAGFTNLTGWPDRAPCGPFSAYTDTTSPRFLTIAVLAALEHRRRTGKGQRVDLSQAESALSMLAPELLELQLSGVAPDRLGNGHRTFSPHGIYPAAGDDRWIAIACRNDADWQALCDKVELDDDLRSLALPERRARESEIDRRIEEWTRRHDAESAADVLCRSGVPAHGVQGSTECFADPQLASRGYFVSVPHATQPDGRTIVEAGRFKLSRTPALIDRAGPSLGEHNDEILRSILQYDDDRIAVIAESGALG